MLSLCDSAYHAAQGLPSFTQWLYLTLHWIHVRCISRLTARLKAWSMTDMQKYTL